MTEVFEPEAAKDGPLASDAASQLTKASQYARYNLADAGQVMVGEMWFAGNEFLDRTITETHLFNEFLSRMAEAHSLKDYGAMYRACSRRQLDFVRRETERFLKHRERMIDNTSKLVESWRQN